MRRERSLLVGCQGGCHARNRENIPMITPINNQRDLGFFLIPCSPRTSCEYGLVSLPWASSAMSCRCNRSWPTQHQCSPVYHTTDELQAPFALSSLLSFRSRAGACHDGTWRQPPLCQQWVQPRCRVFPTTVTWYTAPTSTSTQTTTSKFQLKIGPAQATLAKDQSDNSWQ